MDLDKNTSQQPGGPVLDSQGQPVVDEAGREVRWATKGQRVIALVLAVAVILITLAFAYALSTGQLFRR